MITEKDHSLIGRVCAAADGTRESERDEADRIKDDYCYFDGAL